MPTTTENRQGGFLNITLFNWIQSVTLKALYETLVQSLMDSKK